MDYQLLLKAELEERRRHNSQYSARSLARDLGLAASDLCQFMSGKKPVSRRAAAKILAGCKISRDAQIQLLWPEAEVPVPEFIDLDSFSLLADWYHLALLSSIENLELPHSHRVFAQRLGLSEGVVLEALERLERQGLIAKIPQGYKRCGRHFYVQAANGDLAIRSYHQQILTKASESIDRVPHEQRHFSCWTLAMDEKHIPEVAKQIEDFQKLLVKRYRVKNQPSARIMSMGFQLFPLDKSDS